MNETGIIFKIPSPLETGDQQEGDYYCSVDGSYCKPKKEIKENKQKMFNSVCSIKGGTSICSDVETFESFYSTTPSFDNDDEQFLPINKIGNNDIKKIYDTFVAFYGDVQFFKVKDNATHSIYMCKVESGLMREDHYMSAVVNRDRNSLGSRVPLSQLKWDSFQCRKIPDGYDIPSTMLKNNLNDVIRGKIDVIKRTDQCSQYKCETLPILVTLLHKKVGFKDQYNSSGKLYLALNQFDTIITF
jgi:hypothetical protein